MEKMEGCVKRFYPERGYGFITDERNDYFVHYTDIVMEGFRTLSDGQRVSFSYKETEKGLLAYDVKVIGGRTYEA